VTDGTTFYLQDATGDNPLTADNTLATVVVHLQKSVLAGLHFRGGTGIWTVLLVVGACFVRRRAIAAAALRLGRRRPRR
jgi:hypothetical protein